MIARQLQVQLDSNPPIPIIKINEEIDQESFPPESSCIRSNFSHYKEGVYFSSIVIIMAMQTLNSV